MKKAWIFFLSMFITSLLSNAQVTDDGVPRNILHDRERSYALTFQSNGWGFGGDVYTKGKDAYTFWKWSADLHFYRHEKEVKSYFQDPQARAYYYGKMNSFFVLRLGTGQNKEFAEKLRKNGVQIDRLWQVGPSIGFVKPVYLQILYASTVLGRYQVRSEKFNPNEHYTDNIYGRSSNLTGLNETKVQLGLFFKLALRFEYSPSENGIRGVEIGATADVYPKRIEIMSQEILNRYNDRARNHFIFPAIYTRFFFGSKYNKK